MKLGKQLVMVTTGVPRDFIFTKADIERDIEQQKGQIRISLQQIGKKFTLVIADNGVGVQENTDDPRIGFSSQLIHLLVM
ncbi:MAG: hypothetical protein AAF806_09105 [Bacteroidota bacterium]